MRKMRCVNLASILLLLFSSSRCIWLRMRDKQTLEDCRVNYTHVCTAQTAQLFYPYTYRTRWWWWWSWRRKRRRKKSSSINYVLCHNMNECQPVKETNGLRYASSSMSSFSSSSIDDWLIDLFIDQLVRSLKQDFFFLHEYYIYIYVIDVLIIFQIHRIHFKWFD